MIFYGKVPKMKICWKFLHVGSQEREVGHYRHTYVLGFSLSELSHMTFTKPFSKNFKTTFTKFVCAQKSKRPKEGKLLI